MVKRCESYIRWDLSTSAGVIFGAAAVAAAGPGGDETRLGAFLDQRGLVLGHQREHAENELAVRGRGVDDAVGQRVDPDVAFGEGGDDVDEVTQVAAEAVNFQMTRVSPGRRSARQAFHCGRSALVPVAVAVSV